MYCTLLYKRNVHESKWYIIYSFLIVDAVVKLWKSPWLKYNCEVWLYNMKEKRVMVEKNKRFLVKTRTRICVCWCWFWCPVRQAGTVLAALTPAGRLAVGRGTAGGHFLLRLCLSQRYCSVTEILQPQSEILHRVSASVGDTTSCLCLNQRYYSVPLPQSEIGLLQHVSDSARDTTPGLCLRDTTACLCLSQRYYSVSLPQR